MPKPNLPRKVCVRCGRPFTWRKKWARDWDQVRYCSERCRRGQPSPRPSGPANR
ncbi:MAG: DUF2256 domain-containing protein [Planctomycetaceae bacterium]|nr:DUF2256 domain-containing protein [Planctomycetaceae bacterium]